MRSRFMQMLAWATVLACTAGCRKVSGQQAAPYPVNDTVVQYLLSRTPRWQLATYRILTELRYPIPDQRSLDTQLSARPVRDSTERFAMLMLREGISRTDFPLASAYNGLDKWSSKLGYGGGPALPSADGPGWDPGDLLGGGLAWGPTGGALGMFRECQSRVALACRAYWEALHAECPLWVEELVRNACVAERVH